MHENLIQLRKHVRKILCHLGAVDRSALRTVSEYIEEVSRFVRKTYMCLQPSIYFRQEPADAIARSIEIPGTRMFVNCDLADCSLDHDLLACFNAGMDPSRTGKLQLEILRLFETVRNLQPQAIRGWGVVGNQLIGQVNLEGDVRYYAVPWLSAFEWSPLPQCARSSVDDFLRFPKPLRDLADVAIAVKAMSDHLEDAASVVDWTETKLDPVTHLRSRKWKGLSVTLEGNRRIVWYVGDGLPSEGHPVFDICPPELGQEGEVLGEFEDVNESEVPGEYSAS